MSTESKQERAERLRVARERRALLHEIELALSDIRGAGNDPEHAHLLADKLYMQTLRAIADGTPHAAALAAKALEAEDISAVRWYA